MPAIFLFSVLWLPARYAKIAGPAGHFAVYAAETSVGRHFLPIGLVFD